MHERGLVMMISAGRANAYPLNSLRVLLQKPRHWTSPAWPRRTMTGSGGALPFFSISVYVMMTVFTESP